MATAPPSSPHYEPKPRWYHCGALVEGRWITYGGIGADGGVADPPLAAIFDQDKEEWTQMPTSGTPPSSVVGAVCIAVGPLLYHIGGAGGAGGGNTVHCLDTRNKRWLEIQPANPEEAPMKKWGMGGISYGNTLVTVGGYGDLPTNHHPGVEYIHMEKFVCARATKISLRSSVYRLLIRIISVKFRVIWLLEVVSYTFSLSEARQKL